MDWDTVRRIRRVLSAVVAVSAIMLVMARVRSSGPQAGGEGMGTLAAVVFAISLVAFVLVWRKEHAAAEAEFRARESQQLAALRLQLELAQLAARKADADGNAKIADGSPGSARAVTAKDVTNL